MKYFLYCRRSSEDDSKQIQSIEDQEKILKSIASQRGFEIVEVLKESKSAKSPGRPLFNYMIGEITRGVAQGILCWKLDRLARNPVDGGTINWMLQQGTIGKIVTNERDHCPGDNVLMMSVEFGMANQFVLDLGKNSKRGMVSKCGKGWLPGVAPIGYLNDRFCEKGNKTIIKDSQRFDLIRKMWDLMLTGGYSVKGVCDKANKEWGFTTLPRRKNGGTPLSVSTLYWVFNNPFYYGDFEWDGEFYKGAHEPMITRAEFDHVQKILGDRGRPRPKGKNFAFTGLIRCGECGCMVTAEDKSKYIKSEQKVRGYTYYHCTHKKKNIECKQGGIEQKELEKQINDFLQTLTLEEGYIDWIIKYLYVFNEQETVDRSVITDGLKVKLDGCTRRMDNLIKLKISGDLITDAEFKSQKDSLMEEKGTLLERLGRINKRQDNWVESAEKALNFLRGVKERFNRGSIEIKRLILSTLGSNLTLKDKILSLEANIVFTPLQKGILEMKKLDERLEPTENRIGITKKPHDEALSLIWLPRSGSN